MANRYANIPGAENISDTFELINDGFDKVEQDVDGLAGQIDDLDTLSPADRAKLDGIEDGAQVNQNAFARVNDLEADDPSDEVTISGGTGITVTTNPNTKEVIVTATGEATPGPHGSSHLEHGSDPIPYATESTGGLMSAADKQKVAMLEGIRQETVTLPNLKTRYGAIGDGVTDDTQAFLDAVGDLGPRGVLYLPPGTYLIDPDAIVLPEFFRLVGAGAYATTIRNRGHAKTGVGIQTSRGCEVSCIYIRDFSVGIKTTGYWTKLYDNIISYNVVGIDFNTNPYISKCLNNEISFNNIGVLIGHQAYELVIKNNIIDNNNGVGVASHGISTGVIIADNTIEGNRNHSTGNGCGVIICGTTTSRMEISGNWMEENGSSQNSVDIMISPYHPAAAQRDAYAMDIYNLIIDECIPSEYQSLFRDVFMAAGAINITDNAHMFTKHAVIVGGASGLLVNIEKNHYKGSLNRYNMPIYLGFRQASFAKVNIHSNDVSNTDNQAITPQMLQGVRGTYVYSWGTITGARERIRLDGEPLFIAKVRFDDFLTKGTFKEVVPRVVSGSGAIEDRSILDFQYVGKTATGGTTIELNEPDTTSPLFEGFEGYFVAVANKRSTYRVQYSNGWNGFTQSEFNVFVPRSASNLTTGRLYTDPNTVVYGVLLLTQSQYDSNFKMVEGIEIPDLHVQLIA